MTSRVYAATMRKQVNLSEAKAHLSKLVEEAAKGEEIVIARNGKPIAMIVALAKRLRLRKRKLGVSRLKFVEVVPREVADAEIERLFEESALTPFPD